jgi:hypothetical protein
MKKTKSIQSQTDPADTVASVLERLNVWRATRRRGQRIPEDIWRAAAGVARTHGLNPTARALKLNYYDLQRRLCVESTDTAGSVSPGPTFVELAPPAGRGPSAQSGSLELIHPGGARFSLSSTAIDSADLPALIQAFLRS